MRPLISTRSPWMMGVALVAAGALLVPSGVMAQAQQQAGQVSRSVPEATIKRAATQVPAAANSPVFWQDVVETDRNGRARVSLTDGSVLNVGSESSLSISKHDPTSQQTELDLAYGRVRANVVKITRPGGEFKIKTRSAVAGVVGTDLYMAYINGILELIVFSGVVQLCSLAGQCVTVGAGMMTTQRGNNPPDQPSNVSPAQSMQAARSSQVGTGAAAGAAGGAGLITTLAIIGVVVVSVVVAATVNRGDGSSIGGCVSPQGVQVGGTSPQVTPGTPCPR